MSGRAIGTVVGAVIGFYVGGPQGAYYGAMIGGMAGGLIDPETLQGAQFSGRSIAGSESGLARAIIYGTTVVEGRLMDGEDEPRLGTRTEDAGKGGAEVEHDTALLSYAIEICESSELRDTLVRGVLAVWEDEKLVYDVRVDSLVSPADNAKWKANKQFYFGEEGQAPSAMLEGIHGTGNVPAYVGTCRMDVEDEDLVLHGERIPRYRFLVSRCAVEPPYFLLVTGSPKALNGPMMASAQASDVPSFVGLDPDIGADVPAGIPAVYGGRFGVVAGTGVRYSLDNLTSFESGTHPWGSGAELGELVGGPNGWLIVGQALSAFDQKQWTGEVPPGDFDLAGIGFTDHAWYASGYYFRSWASVLYRATDPNGPWTAHSFGEQDPGNPTLIYVWMDGASYGAGIVATCRDTDGTVSVRVSSDGGVTWPVALVTRLDGDGNYPYFVCPGANDLVVYCFGGGVWTSANAWASWVDTGLIGPVGPTWIPDGGASFYIDGGRRIARTAQLDNEDEDIFYTIGYDTDGDKCVTSIDGGLTWSDPITMPIADAVGIVASGVSVPVEGGIIIPDAPGYEIDPITGEVVGPASDVGNACGMYLDEVVRSLYKLGSQQLTDDMLDLDALAPYYVRGYSVADVGATSADGIEPLRRTYFFDLPEYDGKIHARLRGGDIDWVIDPDDIIPGEESTLEGKRGQETTYPRKLNLSYLALSTDYKPTTQTAEDINPDTFTKSEESYQTNLALEDDEAAKIADVMLKVMRTEREDEQKFSLPIQYVGIIASDLLEIEGRRYRVDQMRVERNRVVIERAVYDRASAYYSDAVGVEGIRRPPPVSSVRGPVASAVFNSPVLRDVDDKAGVYWASAGYLPGYVGALLQMSRDGTNFENGPELIGASTMGVLTATLPSASRYAQDNTNTLKVKLYPGAKDLDSTTFEGLMEEANAFAILYPNGTVEIGQFQTATETAEREYDLTGLMRGRQDTVAGEHLEGAQFVLLDEDVRFVAIRPDDVGKTLTFRAVSKGTRPEDNATQTITFTTIESLREWQPYNVQVTEGDDGGLCISFIGRARLGSSRTPVHSQWFDGYRVTFNDAVPVDTAEQAVCVSPEYLADAGPYPTVKVVARSKVATNDDDFDSPPAGPGTPEAPFTGDPMTDPNYYATWQQQGFPPDGYVGEPYHVRGDGPDSFVWKGSTYPFTKGVGSLGTNVMAMNLSTGNVGESALWIYGIPLTAATETSSLAFRSAQADDSPTDGEVIGSVTFAAKPTYALMDFSERGRAWSYGHVWGGGTDPWCTCYVWSGGGQKSRAEFDTGKVRMEVEATGAMVGSNGSTLIGLVCGPPRTPLYDQGNDTGSCTWPVPAAGIYVVEVDATVNPALVSFRDSAGTLIYSSTLNLPSGQVFKFYWYSGEVGATIRCNMGNWAWDTTPTAGFGGLPNTATVVAAQWSRKPGDYTGSVSPNGRIGPMLDLSGTDGAAPVLAAIGHSTGFHKIGFYDSSRSDIGRVGLCSASTPGELGTTGDSIGYRNSNINDRVHRLQWTFGGVSGSAVLPAGFGKPEEGLIHSRPTWVVFAYDASAAEIQVWIVEESTDSPMRLWTTITGVPADTYYPAMSGTGYVITSLWHGSTEPSAADPWYTTV